jgi:hypothetical protein
MNLSVQLIACTLIAAVIPQHHPQPTRRSWNGTRSLATRGYTAFATGTTFNTPSARRAREARESSPVCRQDPQDVISDPASAFLVRVLLLLKFQTFFYLSQ